VAALYCVAALRPLQYSPPQLPQLRRATLWRQKGGPGDTGLLAWPQTSMRSRDRHYVAAITFGYRPGFAGGSAASFFIYKVL
jgi:hypothetical protein